MQVRVAFSIAAALLPAAAIGSAAAEGGEASIRETTLEIPTYAIGPEDKNPPLWNPNVYPYPMQTDIRRDKKLVKHRAVILENDYVRVIILPDIGGRIYAAHDKTNGDYDFIYHNHVIKPGLVGLRGAWLSGGVEWNFPTRGHTVNTFSPVRYRIIKQRDGGVTCVVGAVEWVRRMQWSVATTLFPDRSCLRTRIRLHNPTLTHNNGYFWANAAVHAWPDTKVAFPPTDYTYAGQRRNPLPWPIRDGKDVSWYRNTARAYDYFCGAPGDYVAAYNHERECGTVHFASRHESFGKKFWTWGTARSGRIWENILTDEDGAYIELQSGRLLTQGDAWIFEPHWQEAWDEYWYPIRDMGGLAKANADAAVNAAVRNGALLAALNVTRSLRDATVRVTAGGGELLRETLSLEPGGSWRRELPVSGGASSRRLVLLDREGREVIRYDSRREASPPPELEPEARAGETASAEELFLAGYYAMKHWRPEQAERRFREALEKDSGLTPALRWLAAIDYKTGRFQEGLELARKALRRNEDDLMARYYRVLNRMALGESERVEEDLDLLGRRAAYRHVAFYLQASRAIAEGDGRRAEERLRRALRQNPDGVKAKTMLACVLRRSGRSAEARSLLDAVLRVDPLNGLALFEQVRLGDSAARRLGVLRDDPQAYLEIACDYLQMNLPDEAAAALRRYDALPGAAPHPLVPLYEAYLADRAGDRARARSCCDRAVELSPDYVFPFRTESIAVLETALQYLPKNWKLQYWLGILLTAKMRWREGLERLEAAARRNPPYSVLYWSLGGIYWRKLQQYDRAQAEYERALAVDPHDVRCYVALDRIAAIRGDSRRRESLFRNAPPEVQSDYRVLLARASYLTDAGQYDEALEILRRHTFHPWEGWTGARELYVRALHLRADQFFERHDYQKAIQDLESAMEWPENLGSGRPPHPDHSREHYQLGLCYKALGKIDQAIDQFRKAMESPAPSGSPWLSKAKEELDKLNR